MKKEVNFNLLDFKEYLSLDKKITNLYQVQQNPNLNSIDREVEIDRLLRKKEEYEANFSLFFDVMSKKGAGHSFSKKAHYELRDRRYNKSKFISPDESLTHGFDDMEFEELEFTVGGTSWRYEIGCFAVVCENEDSSHGLVDGDRIEILAFQDEDDYTYLVKLADSLLEKTFIIKDGDLY